MLQKFQALKDKELKLNADLSKKSVTVSAKGFEGEVTLKFEIETKSCEKSNYWNEPWKINRYLYKYRRRN
ncbi:hypothetical protein HYD46_03890 [Mycoplasmopsis bovis]|nr:hypothetical protein [Mycoplasmopsis bovis]QQH78302.1 hypothetical protein HYD46_03890 [Mycoplasmopsis bovis]